MIKFVFLFCLFAVSAIAKTPTTPTPSPTAAKVAGAAAAAATPTPAPTPQPIGPNFLLTWNSPPSLPLGLAAGTRIKYGSAPGAYTTTVDVPAGANTKDFNNFAPGAWYFVALYTVRNGANSDGSPIVLEISPPSSELPVVVVSLPAPNLNIQPLPGMVNVSTRSQVGSGDDVLIAGFILKTSQTIAVRGLGPSLLAAGLSDALKKPQLELHDNKGKLLKSNTGWKNGPDVAALNAVHLAPSYPNDSALVASLQPGAYTAILRGVNATVGLGLVEAYQLP